MSVLAVASECVPLVKTGGLADVVGALPRALAAHGVAVCTLIPGYTPVMAALGQGGREPRAARVMRDLFGGPARIVPAAIDGLDLLVLDAPHLFARQGGLYQDAAGTEWEDNGVRFAALGAAAAFVAGGGLPGRKFDVLHAHDWQAGLAPAYLRFAARRLASLFTIHNLAFQGKFPATLFPRLGLPAESFATAGLEYYGGVGFMKAALWFADHISTVSPSYAAEIMTSRFGMGLDGLLRGREQVVSGIANGIDTDAWNPATDGQLVARFDAADPTPRAANRAALAAELGLDGSEQGPLFAFIGRLAWQKGIDLVLESIPAIAGSGGRLVILGSGERELEERCRWAAGANPGRIAVFIGYSERLARLLYGGADAVLVPSRFEPCGLTQLIGLRYGALPIVARTGGLADTVIDANQAALAAGTGTGFMAAPDDAAMLGQAIRRAAAAWREPATWRRLQASAMASDVSWRRSAGEYARLLRGLAQPRA
ncbi:MAG: glycogen synthase GlgA [Acetobacteraceae bacterium]|nr:glycogen synthase GlgA [Acetobacteraceae bacterium]